MTYREEGAHCVKDWEPIDGYLVNWADELPDGAHLEDAIKHYLQQGRELYSALVDAGIPWQDARRLLWMGTQTYIHDIYDYLAMQQMLAKRLEHVMDWEHNCVAQLMVREVRMKCPPVMSKYLVSLSDRQNKAAFAGLESWPPDMKYNPNFPCECGHQKANHIGTLLSNETCEVCPSEKKSCIEFKSKDPLPRTHRPEQNPFWILHPDSMDGGAIVWIPTNGTYPEDLRPNR